jgi:hypothetical protein
VDSTAILLRWIFEPASRPCPLENITVITSMTGDEFEDTERDVTTYILPMLREHSVRFVQVARHGAKEAMASRSSPARASRTRCTSRATTSYRTSSQPLESSQATAASTNVASRRRRGSSRHGWTIITTIVPLVMPSAVGDISGKGISSALLMATVHAFVRAYSLEPEMVLTTAALGTGDHRMYYRGDGASQSQLSPAMLMTTLNYQLFRCTPPEKYATMFLGCYDATMRELTYCNAGHLPPIVLSGIGKVSRLEVSGTVVGLFDGATYDESTIAMRPGDLFVAFSDGVTEPENDTGEFGEERLITLIQEHRDQPLPRILPLEHGPRIRAPVVPSAAYLRARSVCRHRRSAPGNHLQLWRRTLPRPAECRCRRGQLHHRLPAPMPGAQQFWTEVSGRATPSTVISFLGLPATREWADAGVRMLSQTGKIEQMTGFNCTPVAVKVAREELLAWIGEQVRDGALEFQRSPAHLLAALRCAGPGPLPGEDAAAA